MSNALYDMILFISPLCLTLNSAGRLINPILSHWAFVKEFIILLIAHFLKRGKRLSANFIYEFIFFILFNNLALILDALIICWVDKLSLRAFDNFLILY
jgi:hypothetical protein